jgi:nucleoid-associated protein YgaU
MTKTLIALGAVMIFAATAAAQQSSATQPPPVTRIQTNEGSILNGTIGGGMVTVRTTFGGDVRIDGRRIVGFAGTTLTLDDGSVLHGTLAGGALQFASAFGTLAIPVERITEIQIPKPATAAATTSPAAAGASPAAKAPPATAAVPAAKPATPTKAAVQIVNETRRNLSVCVNDERPCLQIGPNGSTNRTVDVGPLRLRVESTTQLGFVVVATGNFERNVAVDKDTTVRVTEGDFR